ncbi:MAG: hypothetical protein R6V12_17195 [Candidatus Hydrogenedentota bacterium]
MDFFKSFKNALKSTLNAVKTKDEPALRVIDALEAAGDWNSLEDRVIALRAVSRKRQQEVLECLAPLAQRIEELVQQARATKIRVVKQNLLRQAEGYMQELEAEDEPARIHGANCTMLTNILKQVRRAKAMAERGISEGAIDTIAAHLEEIVVEHQSVLDAVGDLESAGQDQIPAEVQTVDIERRLQAVYGPEEEASSATETTTTENDISEKTLEAKLYE